MAESTLPARFEDKVERIPFSTCWHWVGVALPAGYGKIKGDGEAVELAHRVSHELFLGPIPDGYHVDHLCFNPGCVNPAHLEAVTPSVNMQRAADRQPPQTEFQCGHPFTEKNKYYLTNGSPYCRECHLKRCREYKREQYWRDKRERQN